MVRGGTTEVMQRTRVHVRICLHCYIHARLMKGSLVITGVEIRISCIAVLLLCSQLYLWGYIFMRFLHMWLSFNPTMQEVTFRFCGWCVLDVFLLLAFTCLGQKCQDLLSLCDECMCAQNRPWFILSSKEF